MSYDATRLAFGIPELDRALGGGLRPGTLTVVSGATGIGKSQLGLRWAACGREQEGTSGAVVDVTSRGDSQNHEGYARDQLDWVLREFDAGASLDLGRLWEFEGAIEEILRPFASAGRRVTRSDLDSEVWHAWKMDMARMLRATAYFAYAHLIRDCRRFVLDGFEPSRNASDSAQFDFFEYLYERVLRQDDTWAAREVLREAYHSQEARVLAHRYDASQVGCLLLYTAPQLMLDEMLQAEIGGGDLFATANTVIHMGRVHSAEGGLGRGLRIVKHRGSACDDGVLRFTINARGLSFLELD